MTVVNPPQDATVVRAAATAGHALTFAYERKMTAAAEDCQQQGIAFLPLAAESLGGWHQTAEREVKKLAAALARNTGKQLPTSGDDLVCSFSEGTLHCWGTDNRVSAPPDAAIDGII